MIRPCVVSRGSLASLCAPGALTPRVYVPGNRVRLWAALAGGGGVCGIGLVKWDGGFLATCNPGSAEVSTAGAVLKRFAPSEFIRRAHL